MNNLEKIYQQNRELKSFSRAYLSYEGNLISSLNETDVEAFIARLDNARLEGKTIFIAGNGGSASTASHMAMDLGQILFKLPYSHPPFKTISLADNSAMVTAIGNDFGYEHIFTKQLEMYFKAGDVLVVISASGNSQNLVNAAEWVKENKGEVLGLLGFDGGKLKSACSTSIVVGTPIGEYGPVEDVHLVINHLLFAWFYYKYQNSRDDQG